MYQIYLKLAISAKYLGEHVNTDTKFDFLNKLDQWHTVNANYIPMER